MIVLLNDTSVDGAAELKTITEDSAEWKKMCRSGVASWLMEYWRIYSPVLMLLLLITKIMFFIRKH